jgi:hypothetical protein
MYAVHCWNLLIWGVKVSSTYHANLELFLIQNGKTFIQRLARDGDEKYNSNIHRSGS